MSRSRKADVRELLLEERLVGYLDPHAERYLLKINGPYLTTTSSCTGRITLVEGKWHWLRDSARVVFKTHGKISIYQLAEVLARPYEDLWLKVTGPILHARVRGLDKALKLLSIARDAGFKHSGIMHIESDETLMVELISAVQVSEPLKANGKWLVEPSSLKDLVDLSNRALEEGWRRLARLSELIESIQPSPGSSYKLEAGATPRSQQGTGPCPS
ncbi:hypothetical protein [Acidilobus sp. 7A]|uniref:tRNA(Phe) 7-((3-amino-3-carboxypropyl)-4-demethylwyosine(37)-N(4))- methyltransferase n=1 Tax=Acidilobus sp. 7A TaxID=1577685 RepID=UPI000E3D3D08|nr:hypothetical protein [Acidilobus sp. 7A]